MTARRVDVYFHKKGRIDIMANTSRSIFLEKGDVIDVFFDTESRELYLYIKTKSCDIGVFSSRYRHVATPTNSKSSNMRVRSIDITNFVNRLTNAEESWLFVGEPTTIKKLGVVGLPLIYLNNQYKKRHEQQSIQSIIGDEDSPMVL